MLVAHKSIHYLFFVICVSLASQLCVTQSFAQDSTEADDSSVREFLRTWQDAFNANDATAHTKLYSKKEDVLILLSNGRKLKGFQEIRDEYKQTYDLVEFINSKYKIEKISTSKKMAWAVGIHEVDLREKKSKQKYRLHVRCSFVLTRAAKSWKIVLEHASPLEKIPRLTKIK